MIPQKNIKPESPSKVDFLNSINISQKEFNEKSQNKENLAISQYEEVIKYLADSKHGMKMPNSGMEHARIVMSNIFRTATNYVYIFAGNLKGDVSNNIYVTQLESFLKKDNIKLKVVLEKSPSIYTDAIKLVLKYREAKPNDIEIGYLREYSDSVYFDNYKIKHFTIADDRMYRLEEDTTKYIADVNFNDKTETEKLKNKFTSFSVEKLEDEKITS